MRHCLEHHGRVHLQHVGVHTLHVRREPALKPMHAGLVPLWDEKKKKRKQQEKRGGGKRVRSGMRMQLVHSARVDLGKYSSRYLRRGAVGAVLVEVDFSLLRLHDNGGGVVLVLLFGR